MTHEESFLEGFFSQDTQKEVDKKRILRNLRKSLYIMKHAKFLKNVAVITVGGALAKGIGALYKIPLTGILGGYGMGLYQMAYPFFCLVLTFSSAGVPSALSRMIAGERAHGGRETARVALKLFALIGGAGSILMCLIAPFVARIQGSGLPAVFYALSPAVFLVSVISVLRGYFQGLGRMEPTALSELIEQSVKAVFGLLLARNAPDPASAAVSCLFAVSLSELAAAAYLLLRFRLRRERPFLRRRISPRCVLYAVLPVMASAALLPLSSMCDSVVIVRLLGGGERAVSLYGLFSGGALALVGLPASLCCGIATAVVPAVSSSRAEGREDEARRRTLFALSVSLVLSAVCAAGLLFFAGPAVRILYPRLPEEDLNLLVRLIRLSALSAVLLAGTDTLSAALTGMGKAGVSARNLGVAVLVKLLLQILLLPDPAFGIAGAAIASNACYLVAFFLDLLYTVRKQKERANDHGSKSRNGAGGLDPQRAEGAEGCGRGACPHRKNSVGADA